MQDSTQTFENKKRNWFTIGYIESQENQVKKQTEEFFGRNRNGFSQFALDAIEVIMQGTFHLRDIDEIHTDENGADFKRSFRAFADQHYYRIVFTCKAIYHLFHFGYYTEASILMRNLIETFIRLKYIEKQQSYELIMSAFAGSMGYQGKKFTVKYKEQFDSVAPGLYNDYRTLCDIAHGEAGTMIFKSELKEGTIKYDDGLIFKALESTFVVNQFCVYLLAHLEYMMHVFPEIKLNMPPDYAVKYHQVTTTL
ncbi:MAG: hypothetical protein EPO24_04915 [Bacteroidetes bacterium]|nr:MAG: hypothetical protein EPO24_04915 [Bacteroidota bacterium]